MEKQSLSLGEATVVTADDIQKQLEYNNTGKLSIKPVPPNLKKAIFMLSKRDKDLAKKECKGSEDC